MLPPSASVKMPSSDVLNPPSCSSGAAQRPTLQHCGWIRRLLSANVCSCVTPWYWNKLSCSPHFSDWMQFFFFRCYMTLIFWEIKICYEYFMLRRDLAAVSTEVCSKKHLQKTSIFKSTINYLTCWKLSVLRASTFGSPHPKRYPCDCTFSIIRYQIGEQLHFFFFLRKLIFESHSHQVQRLRFPPTQLLILNGWQILGNYKNLS